MLRVFIFPPFFPFIRFDAVSGYFTASVEWSQKNGKPDKWKEWWKNKDSKHYYFLAKDNIPFHSLIWPSILMGYDEELELPYDIPANEYLRLKGEQFSKSRGTAVWVPEILKKFDVDAIRYYLSINMPENKDTNWMWEDFIAKNNDELVGTYGNFVHRVITFTQKNFNCIPKKGELTDLDTKALEKIQEASNEVGTSISYCNFKKGLRAAMNLAQFGNVYFDQNQPWNKLKTDKQRCGTTLHICLQLVQALAVIMAPYLPFSSDVIWKMLGHTNSITRWDEARADITEGVPLERPAPLFKKLALEDIVETSDPFSKLDLRVAKILDIKDHPQADKLYIMHVDLGPLGKRIIVAGIKTQYSKDALKGKSIVIVTNLKPARLRGIESKGMLLAAEDDQGTISLLNPQEATPGSEVYIEGIPREPVSLLEFDDFKQVAMTIGSKQEAVYKGKPLKSKYNTVISDKTVMVGAKVL
jgi:methionyl-tRNA synthetase